MGELEALGRNYPFQIPAFFALILRAFSVIEGIALGADADYAIVQECFPYMSRWGASWRRVGRDALGQVKALLEVTGPQNMGQAGLFKSH